MSPNSHQIGPNGLHCGLRVSKVSSTRGSNQPYDNTCARDRAVTYHRARRCRQAECRKRSATCSLLSRQGHEPLAAARHEPLASMRSGLDSAPLLGSDRATCPRSTCNCPTCQARSMHKKPTPRFLISKPPVLRYGYFGELRVQQNT